MNLVALDVALVPNLVLTVTLTETPGNENGARAMTSVELASRNNADVVPK